MSNQFEPGSDLSPTKRAWTALKQMQSKLEAWEKAKTEPIAIVGIGCRFPQLERSPGRFLAAIN